MAKEKSSSAASQLQLMRMLLQQSQPPTIQLAPVQDIGGGIAQGVGNILNVMMQRRQQNANLAALNQMLEQEQVAAQQEAANTTAAYEARGLKPTDAYLPDSVLTNVLSDEQKQAEEQRKFEGVIRRAYEIQSQFTKEVKGEDGQVNLVSTLPFQTAMFFAEHGGGEKLAESKMALLSEAEKFELARQLTNARLESGKPLGDLDRLYMKNIGYDVVGLQKLTAETSKAITEAQYAPQQIISGIQNTQANTSNTQQNTIKTARENTINQAFDTSVQGVQSGAISPTQFVSQLPTLAPDAQSAASIASGVYDKKTPGSFSKVEFPKPQSGLPQQTQAAPPILDLSQAGNTYNRFLQLSPMEQAQQASQYRGQLFNQFAQPFGEALSRINQGFGSALGGLGQNLNAATTLLGVPRTPLMVPQAPATQNLDPFRIGYPAQWHQNPKTY